MTRTLALLLSIVLFDSTGGGASFDLINGETFEGVGYSLGAPPWAEDTGAGQVTDEDETATCPAGTGFVSECLQTPIVTDNRKSAAYHTFGAGAQSGAVYCRVYFALLDTTGLDTGEQFLMHAQGTNGAGPDAATSSLRMYIQNTSGTFEIKGSCGGTVFGTTTITTSTIYLLETYSNQTADSCDFKLDGTAKGPQAATLTNDPTVATFGVSTAGLWQPDLVWDHVACQTTGWIGGL